MKKLALTTFALALASTPVAAQISSRDPGATTRSRVEATREAIEAARRGGVYDDSRASSRTSERGSAKVPRGHLPPRGMCRVWIDGVPPGHQPAVTSCAQAERDRFRYSNARVIYGDRESFPGKGKGRYGTDDGRRECSVIGSVITGCRDDSVDRRDRDDDDRYEVKASKGRQSFSKAAKTKGNGKGAAKKKGRG
ncbi:MAG TPA: hypothetical protein VEB19_04030 [Gemmatimonadaceae bacterium]|nr:hypothetical protein [Gemmatimonadaceae bacterium]